jgi:ribosomal protein S17E
MKTGGAHPHCALLKNSVKKVTDKITDELNASIEQDFQLNRSVVVHYSLE